LKYHFVGGGVFVFNFYFSPTGEGYSLMLPKETDV